MKRTFTKLMAALALLTFLAVPMGMWGQTRGEGDTHDFSQSISQLLNYNASIPSINIAEQSYAVKKVTISYRYNKDIENAVTMAVTVDGTSWGTYSVSDNTGQNYVTVDFEGTSTTGGIFISFTNNTGNGTGHGTFYVNNVRLTEGSSGGGGGDLQDNDLAVSPTSLALDMHNNPNTGTITCTTSSTGAISVSENDYVTTSVSGNTITVTPVAITPSAQTITVNQAADDTYAAGSATFTVTVANTTPTVNVTYHANGGVGDVIVETPYQGSDYTVAANTFSYTGHSFTKWNTVAGGTGQDYDPNDVINNIQNNIDLYAQWEEVNETVDVLNLAFTGISGGSGYGNWSGKEGFSGAVYAGNSAGGSSTSNPSIQLRTSNSNSGIVSTASGGKVTQVEVIWNSSTSSGRKLDIYGKNSAYTAATDLYGNNAGTLIGSITCGNNNPTVLTISGDYEYIGMRSSNNAIYLNEIKITWLTAPSTDPSVTAENVNITYDAEEGNIEYQIVNPVEGASIQALLADGATITNFELGEPANGAVHFTCDANATNAIKTATVTLNYVIGNETLATKDVTVTQAGNPNVFDNISSITEVGTTYSVKGTVVATNDRGFVMGDGTGYVYFYKGSTVSQSVGNMITFEGTTGTYGHIIQFVNNPLPSISEATSSNYNGTPAATVITSVPDYTEGLHLSTYLEFEGALAKSNNNYLITLGESQIQISYPTTAQGTAMTELDGKTVHVKGYFSGINSSNKFTVMLESIEEVLVPYITLDQYTFNYDYEAQGGYNPITYGNLDIQSADDFGVVYCDAQGNVLVPQPEQPEMITTAKVVKRAIVDYYELELSIDLNNTSASRTTYLKVCTKNAPIAYSDLITVTQAAPVPTFDITFDVDGGSFVGNEDFPEDVAEKEAGTYTLPSATKDMYIFTGWNVGDETYAAGAEYTVSGNVDFVAGYAPGVMYNFAGANNFYTDSELTTHPDSGSSNNVGTIYYGDGSAFVASGTKRYFSNASSGYFLLGPTDASLILPTFSGYKITQVKIHSSGGHSTSVAVSIVSGENTASDAQTWSSQNTDYTYNIGEDYQTSTLAVKVTTNNNAQFTSITLVLESYNPNLLTTMDAIYNKAVEVGATSTPVEVDFGGWIVTGVHPGINNTEDDVFVTDGTKGFVIREIGSGFEVGNTLTGTVTCNIELAGNFNARITGVKAGDLTIGQGTPMATTIPMGELSGINTGALVTYNGLTYNNGTLSDGVNTIKKTNFLYNSNNDFTDGFVYSVTGVIWGYSNDVEINPRSANDIVKAPTSIIFTVNNTVFTPNDAYHIELPYLPSGGFVDHVVCVNFPVALTAGDFHVEFCDADGNSLTADPSWIEQAHVTLLPAWSDDPTLYLEVNVDNNADDEARTAYFKVWASSNQEMVYSDIVTVTQAAYAVTYSLATEIVSGKHYIITSGTDGSMKAMGSQNTNNRSAVSVTATNGVIPETEDVYEVVIIGPDVEGYYTLYDVTNAKYLYAAGTGSANNLKTQNDIDDRARWTITFNDDAAVINSITTATDRTLMRYNSGSNCFSCYGSGQNAIYLFAKDNEPTVSYEKGIASYGTSLNGGYYLIASPVGQVTPSESNEFLTNKYDLYAFDQSEEAEWRNYEAGNFNLISGRGYLYANNGENVTLTFEGYPYVGNGKVMLAYDEGAEFAGWNLIGNPYANPATLGNTAFYKMNSTGSELESVDVGTTIDAMEGVFVLAANDGDVVTFEEQTPNEPNSGNAVSQLSINVSKSRGGSIDRAIVRFDNGNQLPKFQLNPKHTKVYFTNDNKDYAVVRSANEGEMPVSFKAETRGTYTLSVNPENVEMSYLHLIDNKTGADVDLLATPSYTFEASNDDYESRFRLVFNANDENGASTGSATFAYYNGSEWVISNPSTGSGDNATLQVVDVMGRVLSSETISGNANVNINQAAGIYMLRLVNGENVKVQKVVVR